MAATGKGTRIAITIIIAMVNALAMTKTVHFVFLFNHDDVRLL